MVPADDALAVIDARGTLTGGNEGARRATGYTAAEVADRPAVDPMGQRLATGLAGRTQVSSAQQSRP